MKSEMSCLPKKRKIEGMFNRIFKNPKLFSSSMLDCVISSWSRIAISKQLLSVHSLGICLISNIKTGTIQKHDVSLFIYLYVCMANVETSTCK